MRREKGQDVVASICVVWFIAITVVVLAYAGPVFGKFTMQPVDVDFKVPVYMDVGLYVEITNEKDLKKGFTLEQKATDKYEGCIEIKIKSSFDITLGCKCSLTDAGRQMKAKIDKCWIDEPRVSKTLSEGEEKRKLCLRLKDVELVHHDFAKKVQVAECTLTVKSAFEAEWVDP